MGGNARISASALTLFAVAALLVSNAHPISQHAHPQADMSQATPNRLRNSGFEADWSEESSHRVLIFHPDGSSEEAERDNIFTPPGWLVWFYHDPDNYDQPEVRDAWDSVDPVRVHSGHKGLLLFTFYRRHDAGLLQQVQAWPGALLRLEGWAHAWSNWHDGPHPDDPRWSEGSHVGYEVACLPEGMPGLDDGDRNFTFRLGIDPTGGIDPYADTVNWAAGMHAYNGYCALPSLEVVAEAPTITVFLRSTTLWPFKHNDAYWDVISLTILGRAYLPLVLNAGGE
mgnify:CR=1 FL=1